MKVNVFPFDTLAHPGTQFQLQAVSPGITYSWSPAAGLSNTSVANPLVTVGAIGDDITYEVVAIDGDGCKAEGYVRIRIYKGPDIYMPTGFTPNGDGLNDDVRPYLVGMKSLKSFSVFNRWGNLVFFSKKEGEAWNGKSNGVNQDNGVYVWILEFYDSNNKLVTEKGTITIIR